MNNPSSVRVPFECSSSDPVHVHQDTGHSGEEERKKSGNRRKVGIRSLSEARPSHVGKEAIWEYMTAFLSCSLRNTARFITDSNNRVILTFACCRETMGSDNPFQAPPNVLVLIFCIIGFVFGCVCVAVTNASGGDSIKRSANSLSSAGGGLSIAAGILGVFWLIIAPFYQLSWFK